MSDPSPGGVLSERQREILQFISRHIEQNGYPPTVREIGHEFGIRSTNGVAEHLKALERKGLLVKGNLKSRALRPVVPPAARPAAATGRAGREARTEERPSTVRVPLVGRVAAGAPLLAEESQGESLDIDASLVGAGGGKVFALRVKGDSMIEDGIFDGDFVFVRQQAHARAGETVVAMVEGEATVKRFHPEGNVLRLQPANKAMEPIYVRREQARDVAVLGVVIGVFRRLPR